MRRILLVWLICFSVQASEITTTSWNVWQLSKIMTGKAAKHRIPHIAEYIKNQSSDFVGVQELFISHSYKVMETKLKSLYPYTTGEPATGGLKKPVSSGLVIYSKFPIEKKWFSMFSNCSGADCFSAKGILIAKTIVNNKEIYLVNTHLQAGKKNAIVRVRQLTHMQAFIKKIIPTGANIIFMGDYNINRDDFANYGTMLGLLNVRDYKITSEIRYSADGSLNSWRKDKPDRKRQIDHIYYVGKFSNRLGLNIDNPKADFSKYENADLSDHFPVHSTATLE